MFDNKSTKEEHGTNRQESITTSEQIIQLDNIYQQLIGYDGNDYELEVILKCYSLFFSVISFGKDLNIRLVVKSISVLTKSHVNIIQ